MAMTPCAAAEKNRSDRTRNKVPDMMAKGPFCSECGAGSEGGGVFRLPRNFPANAPCESCRRRGIANFRAMGERMAREFEEKVLALLFDD